MPTTRQIAIARVFEGARGYHVCSDELSYLDERGAAYPSKAEALQAAASQGYTHATGSGTNWDGVRSLAPLTDDEPCDDGGEGLEGRGSGRRYF
jgi:hypothetical protein